jgi:isoquinoline 1-oxidoreductase beta subunit
VVTDAEVQRDGSVLLTQLWCAHDAGRLVNPDQVRAQCEGNLVWGIGMVFSDRLPVADGRVAAASFADAPIPRMSQVPPMQVLLVDSGEAPGGAGETAIVAAGAAVANALREATGMRLQRLPLQPAALALQAA